MLILKAWENLKFIFYNQLQFVLLLQWFKKNNNNTDNHCLYTLLTRKCNWGYISFWLTPWPFVVKALVFIIWVFYDYITTIDYHLLGGKLLTICLKIFLIQENILKFKNVWVILLGKLGVNPLFCTVLVLCY